MKTSSRIAILAATCTLLLFGLQAGSQQVSSERRPAGAAAEDQTRPIAVIDGRGNFLLAWQEGSNYAGHRGYDQAIAKTTGANLESVVPQARLQIAESQEEHVLAPGADGYLMVWHDLRNGKDYDVYAARIRADGTVLDREGIPVAGGAHNQANPTVVFDGKNYQVAWSDFDGRKYVIKSATVSPAGTVSGPSTLVSVPDRHCLSPYLMASDDGLWLFWSEARRVNTIKAKKLSGGGTFELSANDLAGKPSYATDGRYVFLVLGLLQGKFYDPADVVGILFDTQRKSAVTPSPLQTKIFQRIGSGPRNQVVWIENGSESPRKNRYAGNIRGLNAAWDGARFRAAWTTLLAPQAPGGQVKYQLWTRPVEESSGSFLGQEPKLILESPRPLRNPYMIADHGKQVHLFYDTESDDGRKIIKSVSIDS